MASLNNSATAVGEKAVGFGPGPELVPDAEAAEYPPQDGGVKAWLFLIGASIVEVTAWGSTPSSLLTWVMKYVG
jgi:hypothetical protein